MAAVEKAARDLSFWLDSPLMPMDGQNVQVSYGRAEVYIEWDLTFEDPATGASRDWTSGLAEDEVRVFVGTRNLYGNQLGEGGSGGIQLSAGGGGDPADFGIAVDLLQNAADSVLARGDAPIIHELGFTDFLGSGRSPNFQFRPTIGTLTIDSDTNDDGRTDSDFELESVWHFNADVPVAEGKIDLYSVALHEMIHAIGFGASVSWDQQVVGARWTGEHAIAANGGGDQIVAEGHVVSGVVSRTVTSQVWQTPVMAALLGRGTRAELTELDLAILRDLGWRVTEASLPGDFDGDHVLDVDDINQLIAARGTDEFLYDVNSDGRVNADDLLAWVQTLRRTWIGDANLDGQFGTDDLITVFRAGTFETGLPARWEEGDWDGDGVFATTDIIAAFSDGGFERGGRPLDFVSVPEPSGILLLIFTGCAIHGYRP